MPAARAQRAWRAWHAALWLVTGAVVVANVAVVAADFTFPYNATGWSLDFVVHNAWQLVHGEPIYVDPAAGNPTAQLYTPGQIFMLAPLVALFGRQLWTGRLLDLAGAALLLAIVTRETARRVRDRRLVPWAPALALLLGSSNTQALITVNPEVWATAFAFLSLVAARRAAESGRGLGWVVLASFAAVATKQTTLSYVPAAAAALASRSPRRAGLYLLSIAALVAAGAGASQALTGGHFLQYVLLGMRQPFELERLGEVLVFVAVQLGVPLTVVALDCWRRGGATLVRDPFAAALLVTLPVHAALVLKHGAMPNHLLGPTLLAVPLFLSVLDELLVALRPHAALAASVAGVGLLWAASRLQLELPPLVNELRLLGPRRQVAEQLERVIRESPGPVWVPHAVAFAWRNGANVEYESQLIAEFKEACPAVTQAILTRLREGAYATLVLPRTLYRMLPETDFGPVLRSRYRLVGEIGAGVDWGILTPVTVMRRVE